MLLQDTVLLQKRLFSPIPPYKVYLCNMEIVIYGRQKFWVQWIVEEDGMSFHKFISGMEPPTNGVVSLGNDHGVHDSPQMPFALLT